MPLPGAVGKTSSLFSQVGTAVKNSSRHDTLSLSIAMIRKFGAMAHRWS
jgi:hypothetical protein